MNGAIVAALFALGLVTTYVSNLNRQTNNQIAKQKTEAGYDFSQSQNFSSVSLMKSSLDETKGKSGYGAALYAQNYFANTWSLAINPDHANTKAKLIGASKVEFDLLPESLEVKDVADIMNGSKNQIILLQAPTRVEIVKQNHDKVFQAWVRSVDILALRPATKTTPAARMKARVNLTPPEPKGLDLLVKAPGDADFTKNFGSESLPLKEGTYHFRLVGSGVVHYGQISVDSNVNSVGLDPKTGAVIHQANNVMAFDRPLGEVSVVVKAKTSEDKEVNLNSCEFSSSSYSNRNSSFQIVHVTAKAFGVAGEEAEKLRI